jgi:hypothetical protein
VDDDVTRELRLVQFLLADILHELETIRTLLVDDDGEEEEEDATD